MQWKGVSKSLTGKSAKCHSLAVWGMQIVNYLVIANLSNDRFSRVMTKEAKLW